MAGFLTKKLIIQFYENMMNLSSINDCFLNFQCMKKI